MSILARGLNNNVVQSSWQHFVCPQCRVFWFSFMNDNDILLWHGGGYAQVQNIWDSWLSAVVFAVWSSATFRPRDNTTVCFCFLKFFDTCLVCLGPNGMTGEMQWCTSGLGLVSTSSHPPSSPALLSNGTTVVFCALGVWKIVAALVRALLRQLLHYIWDVLLQKVK